MATLQEIVNNVWNSVTGFLKVGGTAAHDAAATGNPVQVGGVYRVADPAVADGDMASLRLNAKGEALVQLTGSMTPTHTAVDVTTTTGEVLATNASRKYALLINDSDTVQYLKIGAAAVVNQGIRLNANGGSYEMAAALGNLATGAINGIHGGSGNKAILVTEGV